MEAVPRRGGGEARVSPGRERSERDGVVAEIRRRGEGPRVHGSKAHVKRDPESVAAAVAHDLRDGRALPPEPGAVRAAPRVPSDADADAQGGAHPRRREGARVRARGAGVVRHHPGVPDDGVHQQDARGSRVCGARDAADEQRDRVHGVRKSLLRNVKSRRRRVRHQRIVRPVRARGRRVPGDRHRGTVPHDGPRNVQGGRSSRGEHPRRGRVGQVRPKERDHRERADVRADGDDDVSSRADREGGGRARVRGGHARAPGGLAAFEPLGRVRGGGADGHGRARHRGRGGGALGALRRGLERAVREGGVESLPAARFVSRGRVLHRRRGGDDVERSAHDPSDDETAADFFPARHRGQRGVA
mmetsp:Transcript_7688/g.28033  ORF Transcript_7688/g.28033 Transcript_7688/m.28033 type:complete len:360 (-) Transcript_7688:1355-2434(-)